MRRREFMTATVPLAASSIFGSPAIVRAQVKWPERPVKIVVPFAPGGSTDTVARPWAEKLSQAFGQQFVIENRGGASGMIGAEAVAKAPADGYTYLLGTNTPVVTLPALRKVAYDPNAFIPVGRVGDAVTGFVIHPSIGIKTFADMVDYARKNPGKLAFGSSGLATAPHLRFEIMRMRTGVDILHVPYRGGADTLNDLLSGAIQLMNESSSIPHVRAGKLTLLNVNHPRRIAEFPNVPTMTELGYPNSDGASWFAIWGIAGTPPEILETFNAKLVEIGKTDDMQQRLLAASAVLQPQTLPEIAQHLKEDSRTILEVLKAANIKLE